MMKLLSIAAVAGGAAAAADDGHSDGGGGRLEGMRTEDGGGRLDGTTTRDLEASTRRFLDETAKRAPPQRVNGRGDKRRGLRWGTERQWRSAHAAVEDEAAYRHHQPDYYSKSGKSSYYDDDYEAYDARDVGWERAYWSSKAGWSKSGKAGWGGGGWGDDELFYLLPTACPGMCVSSHTTGTEMELIDSLMTCRETDHSQLWMVVAHGSYIQIESYDVPHMCIAVDYHHGDDREMLAKTCKNGELVLRDCYDTDYGTEWYFTGGQLVNSLCWGAGLSSTMTVFLDTDNDGSGTDMRECLPELSVWGLNNEAVLKSDTFMFVDHLPLSPVYMTVDEVNDELNSKDDRAVADRFGGIAEDAIVAKLEGDGGGDQ